MDVDALAQEFELLLGRRRRGRGVVGHLEGEAGGVLDHVRGRDLVKAAHPQLAVVVEVEHPQRRDHEPGTAAREAETLPFPGVAEGRDERDLLDERARFVAGHDDVVAPAVRAHGGERHRPGSPHPPPAVAVGDAEQVEVAATVELEAAEEEHVGGGHVVEHLGLVHQRLGGQRSWVEQERVNRRRRPPVAEGLDAQPDHDPSVGVGGQVGQHRRRPRHRHVGSDHDHAVAFAQITREEDREQLVDGGRGGHVQIINETSRRMPIDSR